MIELRGVYDKEVVEMPEDTLCQLIDGLHYVETKEVKPIGAKTKLRELRAFEMVQVDTGFDDDEQPRVMAILPKRKTGFAAMLAATLLSVLAFGCGSGATYHYSYTCVGVACAPPPAMAMSFFTPQATPIQARVIYVNRPMDIQVHRDGTIRTRRPATPGWRNR